MKTTTARFKSILSGKGARNYLVKIDLTPVGRSTLHLTSEDIWEDSFSIDTASSGTSSFDIGSAVIGQCKFTLNNINGDFDNYDFFNAEATVWLGLEGDVSGSTQQYYRMGFYTVDDPVKANGLISLTLLDNMWKFDVPFTEAGVTFTSSTTARSIVQTMCNHCGVTLATQNFHGYDFPITSAPDGIDEMNCREMLQYIAMIGCNFCMIDDSGALNIKWYNTSATSATTITFDLNQNLTLGTDDITITGVKFTIKNTDYTIGSSGYRIELENPLVTEDNVNSVLNSIWSVLRSFTLRTFNLTTASDLSAEIGDRCKIKDYRGNYTYSWITMNSFKLAAHLVQCNAEPPIRTLVKRYSKSVKAAVEASREQAQELISTYDQSVQRLNKLVEQSMGAYSEYEDAQTGGRVYYISNMPITKSASGVCSFETGSIVWRMAGDAFSVSDDGGLTWKNGYNPTTGELVVNLLSAVGIQAEWVRTGTLYVGGSTSGTQYPTIEVYDASDNLICEINRNGITMHRGIISSPDYEENPDPNIPYSVEGMKLDVLAKELISPDFAINTGGAYFKGEILITQDINIGTNSCKFIPANYGIADDFFLTLKAPNNFSGSVHYEVASTNGTGYSIEAEGDITDDEPIDILLDPLINTREWYKVTISSGSSIKVYISQATLAYVGQEGFKGHLQGIVEGKVESSIGKIANLYYGADHNGDRLAVGDFECVAGNDVTYYDTVSRAIIVNNGRVSVSENGCIHINGDGDYNNGTLFTMSGQNGGNAIFGRIENGDPIFVKSVSDGQGSYIDNKVLWDSDIETSATDSPPASLADGHLFLVYE